MVHPHAGLVCYLLVRGVVRDRETIIAAVVAAAVRNVPMVRIVQLDLHLRAIQHRLGVPRGIRPPH